MEEILEAVIFFSRIFLNLIIAFLQSTQDT
jgi:hypothetical protein